MNQNSPPYVSRSQLIRHLEQWLLRHDLPRVHMTLIVTLTGLVAAGLSFLLLRAGWESMWSRYSLAGLGAYGVFLLLLRLWLQLRHPRQSVLRELDVRDGLDAGCDAGQITLDVLSSSEGPRSTGSEVAGSFDLEELGLLILAVVAAGLGLVVCGYVIWTAPALMAELLVDSFLMAGVYRGLRKQDPSHWWQGAFRKTWLSAAAVIFFFSVAGLALQAAVPEAHSIGAVVRHWWG